MNRTEFGFQLLDLSDLTANNRTFKAGVYDRVKEAVTGHKKNFIVKGRNDQYYVISNADVLYNAVDQLYRIVLPIGIDGNRQIVFVESTDYYRVITTPVAETIRPTAYGITVNIGTLNFDEGIVVEKEITGIANVVNGATFAQYAQVGDTVNLVIKGVINDTDTTEKDIMVVVPCAVTHKSTNGVEFDNCFIAPTGREVLVEAVNNDTTRVSYIVNFGNRVGKILRVGSDTKLQFVIQKMV